MSTVYDKSSDIILNGVLNRQPQKKESLTGKNHPVVVGNDKVYYYEGDRAFCDKNSKVNRVTNLFFIDGEYFIKGRQPKNKLKTLLSKKSTGLFDYYYSVSSEEKKIAVPNPAIMALAPFDVCIDSFIDCWNEGNSIVVFDRKSNKLDSLDFYYHGILYNSSQNHKNSLDWSKKQLDLLFCLFNKTKANRFISKGIYYSITDYSDKPELVDQISEYYNSNVPDLCSHPNIITNIGFSQSYKNNPLFKEIYNMILFQGDKGPDYSKANNELLLTNHKTPDIKYFM